jgi:hypothetical protein
MARKPCIVLDGKVFSLGSRRSVVDTWMEYKPQIQCVSSGASVGHPLARTGGRCTARARSLREVIVGAILCESEWLLESSK